VKCAAVAAVLAGAIVGFAHADDALRPAAGIPSFAPVVSIEPRNARVFTGSVLHLQARLVGLPKSATFRWTLQGPGALSPSGDVTAYQAPPSPASAIVAAAAASVGAAVNVRSVPPPRAGTPLLLVACFDRGEVDARSAVDGARIGEAAVAQQAGSIALDTARHLALVTARDRVAALDLATMQSKLSAVLSNALFSQAVELANGYFAVTDANANAGQIGVRFYVIDRRGVPRLAGGVAAGETPEGVAAERDGRAFFVSNVNGNSIMRYSFDGRGRARLIALRKTGTRPFGMAIDERDRLLFVADNDTPMLSGARSRPGLETFQLPGLHRARPAVSTGTPEALPLGVAVDEPDRLLFVTNEGDATVAVYRLPDVKKIASLQSGLTPWMPAVDPLRRRLYVPSARSDALDVFDIRKLVGSRRELSTCSYPTGVAVDG